MNGDCVRFEKTLANCEAMILTPELAKHLDFCESCLAALELRRGRSALLRRAVSNDAAAPAALRARIRLELHQSQSVLPTSALQRWLVWFEGLNKNFLYAAVAAMLLITVGGVSRLARQQHWPAGQLTQANLKTQLSAHNERLLKIGFDNHVHCAIARDYSSGPRALEQMAQSVGALWIDLVPKVAAHVPTDYRVMLAHHCHLNGREFIHLVLSNHQGLLSLVLTKKNGESFDAQAAIASVETSALPQMSASNISVVGFETAQYLGYVVSGLSPQRNLELAVQLAPVVREYIGQRES